MSLNVSPVRIFPTVPPPIHEDSLFNFAPRTLPNECSPSFGYSSPLKTLFKKGKFPSVKYGFYGDKLNSKNASLEHLKAKSKGGVSALFNYVLASVSKNKARGNADLREHFVPWIAARYLFQFEKVSLPEFDGIKYIKSILGTLKKEFDIDPKFYQDYKDKRMERWNKIG